MRWIIAALACLLASAALGMDTQTLDRQVDDWRRQAGLPGLSYALVRDGRLQHAAAFGVDDQGRALAVDQALPIGSISKALTAHAVLLAAQQGRLQLDDPLRRYLPDLQLQGEPADRPVSLRDLLNHRSGLPRAAGYQGFASSGARLQSLQGLQLAFPPGSAFDYSNANYDLLGLVLESIHAQPFAAIVRQHWQDAGIQAGLPATDSQVGYCDWFGVDIARADSGLAVSEWPSGGVQMSAPALAEYLIGQIDADRDGYAGLDRANLQRWQVEAADHPSAYYSFGWFRRQLGQATVLGHEGLTGGSNAAVLFDPAGGWAVVVLTNSNVLPLLGRPPAQQIASAIARQQFTALPVAWDGFAGLATERWVKWILLAWFAIAVWRALFAKPRPRSRRRRALDGAVALLLPLLLLVLLPHWIAVPLPAILQFSPDLGAILVIGALLPLLGWWRGRREVAA